MVILGGVGFSYERDPPVPCVCFAFGNRISDLAWGWQKWAEELEPFPSIDSVQFPNKFPAYVSEEDDAPPQKTWGRLDFVYGQNLM